MKFWIWIRKSWRRLLIRSALLIGLWVVLSFVVAMQLYFMGMNAPLQIPWALVAESTLRDWIPWMLLSPVVVAMADLFQFDRRTWRSSLVVHLLACVLVAFAFEGLMAWMLPKPQLRLFTAGGFGAVNGVQVLQAGEFGGDSNLMPNLPSFERANPAAGAVQVFPGKMGGGYVMRLENPSLATNLSGPPFPLSTHAVGTISGGGPVFSTPSLWRQLLYRAAIRIRFTTPIYCCIVCLCWVFTYFRESHERERRALELEKRLTQANLQTLKTQLQPHFLFNTLNAISSLVRKNPDAADDMIGSLSDFLRMNLDTAYQHEVPLRREIEFLDLYLEIQQARFGERLRVQKEIDPSALGIAVPTLILQPLVENSVRHGIEPRETGGTIVVRAQRHNDTLRLEVRDDGEGLKGDQLLAIRHGIGLSNTKARLQELYGDAHRFLLTPNVGRGLVVVVDIPWREFEASAGINQTTPAA
jgi:hypothetical protein